MSKPHRSWAAAFLGSPAVPWKVRPDPDSAADWVVYDARDNSVYGDSYREFEARAVCAALNERNPEGTDEPGDLPREMWLEMAPADEVIADCSQFIRQTHDFKRVGAEAVARLCVLLDVAQVAQHERKRLRSWLEAAPTLLTAGRYKNMGAVCLAYDALNTTRFATDPPTANP